MSWRARVLICAGVVVALSLGAWLVFGLLEGGEPALQGKDELIGSLVPGRVLYIKYEHYQDERISFCGPEQPQTAIGESWWKVGADGLFSGVDVVRGPEGELLTYIESTGNESESVDVATGQRMYYPFVAGSAKTLPVGLKVSGNYPCRLKKTDTSSRGGQN